VKDRNVLIKSFFAYEGVHDVKKTNMLVEDIEAYLSVNEDDTEMYCVLQILLVYKIEYEQGDFETCRNMAKSIVEYFLNANRLSFVEIAVVSMVIVYTTSHVIAFDLAQKAIDMLDNEHAKERTKENIRWMMQYNMTYRLQRAISFEIKDPLKQEAELAELKKSFFRYWNLAMDTCIEHELTGPRKVLETRKAIVDGDCDLIFEKLAAFDKKTKADKLLVRTTTDEVVEYLYHCGKALSIKQRNWLVGAQIRKRRTQLGMTTDNLADVLKIDRMNFNRIERGETSARPERLYDIAKALNVEITYFYGNVSDKPITDAALQKMSLILQDAPEELKGLIVDMAEKLVKFHQP